jgi:isocitrate dehydrogenase
MTGWFSVNGLTLNMEKTNIMKFTSSYHQNEAFQIVYQKKKIITGTNNTKFLGSELDKNISWKNHVQKIIPKLSSACYLVRRMCPCCNSVLLK